RLHASARVRPLRGDTANPQRGRARPGRGSGPGGALLRLRCTGGARMNDDKLRLGGMALRNGLLVHGPTHWAAAVRTQDGEIKVASGRKPRLGGRALERIPGVRGVAK